MLAWRAMAKPIVVRYQGGTSTFDHHKVDRPKIYGRKVRLPLDPDGQPCERALLTDDGALVLRAGMVGQGYFDGAGEWIPTGDLLGLDGQGEPLHIVPSTLGVPQELEPVEPWEALDFQVRSVHVITPETLDPALDGALARGEIFRFPFNYGADYHAETALLVRNDEGTFCLVGVPLLPAWAEPNDVPVYEEPADLGDLDFEMFLAMYRRIHLTNASGRDAMVSMALVPHETSPRLGLRNRPVAFRRYVNCTAQGTHEALARRLGDDYAEALVEGDPEIDLEVVGRTVPGTVAVYLSARGDVLHATPAVVEAIFGPDNVERERRAAADTPANVHDEQPLRWTGRKVPLRELARRFTFRRTIQIFHIDGLTYDFLLATARQLDQDQCAVLLGAGVGADPLVFEANGRPYRGFLSGRIDPENPARYRLLLHLSDMELKPPPPDVMTPKPPPAEAPREDTEEETP